jgi:LmbE family N-acetylglucosaminyl deacetylase
MQTRQLFIRLLFLIGIPLALQAQYFPETGYPARYQRSLDTRSRLTVLSISLQPGYEDFATLGYFRLARGARVISAYVTNGEGGESDIRGEYPNQLAAERRSEAAKAITLLGGGAYFLNMPDIAAASDTGFVRARWETDTLQARLVRLILNSRPDIILVPRDWARGVKSPQAEVFQSVLVRAIRRAEATKVPPKSSSPQWSVGRLLVDDGRGKGVQAPVERVHPIWKRSYREIGEEAARAYATLAVQRQQWEAQSATSVTYEQLYPRRTRRFRTLEEGLPRALPKSLGSLERQIEALTAATMQGPRLRTSTAQILGSLTAMVDSVDRVLWRASSLTPQGRAAAVHWKIALEDLRTTIMGVQVYYTLSPSILAERQLTVLKIDSVKGFKVDKSTMIYFLGADLGWVINESHNKQFPLELHKDYRILSPTHLEYDLPASLAGLSRPSEGSVFMFAILRESKKRDESFQYRVVVPVQFCPRFTVEVLTPIVRAMPSERVIVRLTNHTRDAVIDSVQVNDSLAFAPKRQFHLNVKDQSLQDTLVLSWRRPLEEGSYIIPVKIETEEVARFGARRFDVRVDSSKLVALVTGVENSPTADALRRIGAAWSYLTVNPDFSRSLASYQVVVLDHRLVSLQPAIQEHKAELAEFVERGGHLILFAQDAVAWTTAPWIEGLNLTATSTYDEETGVEADSTSQLMTRPNVIHSEDWMNWLARMAYNQVSGKALDGAEVPVKVARDGNALIVQWKKGGGTLTYVDLALHPQFLNVQAGAYRLLANLLSY